MSYLEGAWFLATNNLLPSSEQQLVKCDTVDSGCNGELMDNASASAKKNAMWTETGHSCMVPPHRQLAAIARAAAQKL